MLIINRSEKRSFISHRHSTILSMHRTHSRPRIFDPEKATDPTDPDYG